MKINHIIIGAANINESIKFYHELFDLDNSDVFIDTGTGAEGTILTSIKDNQFLQFLIVPFEHNRLPNPQHIAFEVTEGNFSKIYNKALRLNIPIRKNPKLDDSESGIGTLNTILYKYKIFYMTDPSNVNIEIMCIIQ